MTSEMPDDLSRVDPAAVFAIFGALQRTTEFDLRIRDLVHGRSRRGSLARLDEASPHARFVAIFATQAVAVANDHMKAWRLIVEGALQPVWAQMTLVRACIEGAATARWLVDDSVSPTERLGRGMAAAIEDRRQRAAFERDAKISVPERSGGARSGAERVEEFRELRAAAGLPEIKYPQYTELMKQFGGEDGPWLYRLVSAFAHAKEWALHATNKVDSRAADGEPGTHVGRVESNEQIVSHATLSGMDRLADAIASIEAYRSPRSLDNRFRGPQL